MLVLEFYLIQMQAATTELLDMLIIVVIVVTITTALLHDNYTYISHYMYITVQSLIFIIKWEYYG